jgi:alkanesulfonate monooxygenase SsuD/methylene tetrahydromethanopterin reductase-like flavin-dependent oxidoreductase (luciferase family)
VTAPVSIGIHVPTSAVAALGPGDAYAEFFRQVEALGLDAIWTEDRIFHAANVLDPLMLLGSAAACTRRIQLGTAVVVSVTRRTASSATAGVRVRHVGYWPARSGRGRREPAALQGDDDGDQGR